MSEYIYKFMRKEATYLEYRTNNKHDMFWFQLDS